MRYLLALAAVFLLALAFFISPAIRDFVDEQTAYSRQQHAFALERERLALQQEEQWLAASAPAWVLLDWAFVLLAITALGLILWAAVDWYRLRRRLVLYGGQWVAREMLEQDAVLNQITVLGHQQTRIELARNSYAVPHHVAYSPKFAQSPAAAVPLLEQEKYLPTLPDVVRLADVLAQIPQGELAYGIVLKAGGEGSAGLPQPQLLTLPLGRGYHGLYHGDTRSGKTNAIDAMIVQLHHQAAQGLPVSLYAGDIKGELSATWSRSPLFAEGIYSEAKDIAALLEELVNGPDGIRERYRLFGLVGEQTRRIIRNIEDYRLVTGEQPRLIIAFIDEINAVIEEAKKNSEFASILKRALQMGAGAGIFIMGGAQYLSAQTLSRDGSKQFVTRAHFGQWDDTAVRMIFGDNIDRKALAPSVTGQQGRGLIRTVTQQPQPFQALLASEQDILQAMALVREPSRHSVGVRTFGRAQTNAVLLDVEASKELAAPAVRTFAAEVPIPAQGGDETLTNDERIQIAALAKAGIPRGRIADQVWGHRRKYDALKAFLDANG